MIHNVYCNNKSNLYMKLRDKYTSQKVPLSPTIDEVVVVFNVISFSF